MVSPKTTVQLNEHTKPVLQDLADNHGMTMVSLLSKVVVGFAMLEDIEREAILTIGKQGNSLLELGCKYTVKEKWYVTEEIELLLRE